MLSDAAIEGIVPLSSIVTDIPILLRGYMTRYSGRSANRGLAYWMSPSFPMATRHGEAEALVTVPVGRTVAKAVACADIR
jgi:hypothetical protein